MKIIRTIKQICEENNEFQAEGKTIGFVPTMGALHRGHISLIEKARQENDKVVCSIFVNPIQFTNAFDLLKYPRTIDQDIELLEAAGCDILFCPDEEEMCLEKEKKIYDLGVLDKVMEGKYRPGHFNGVAIVVKKLFDIVSPDRAYFGEKDFQQLAVIKTLVRIEQLDVKIVACNTEREDDGLAMSSRNIRLSASQRIKAPMIYQTLLKAKEMLRSNPPSRIKKWVESVFDKEPEIMLEYFEIADVESFLLISDENISRNMVVCIAAYIGEVRLIDNVIFNS